MCGCVAAAAATILTSGVCVCGEGVGVCGSVVCVCGVGVSACVESRGSEWEEIFRCAFWMNDSGHFNRTMNAYIATYTRVSV